MIFYTDGWLLKDIESNTQPVSPSLTVNENNQTNYTEHFWKFILFYANYVSSQTKLIASLSRTIQWVQK